MPTRNDFAATADLKKYWKAVTAHKLILIFSTLTIFSLSVLGVFLIKPRYQSSVKILIKVPESANLLKEVVDLGDRNLGPIRSRILSYNYLQKVVDRLGIVKRLREKVATGEYAQAPDDILERLIIRDFQENSLMVLGRGDFVFEILAEDEDPQLAMKIANTTADVFIEETMLDEQSGINKLYSFIGEQLDKYKNRLLNAEEKLSEYKSKNIISEEITLKTRNIAANETQKATWEMDLKAYSLELENLNKIVLGADSLILDYYNNNPQIFTTSQAPILERNIADTQQALSKLLEQYTQLHPLVVDAQRQLRTLQDKLLAEVKNEIQKKINSYERETSHLKLRILDLEKKIGSSNEDLKSLPAQELEYIRLLREKETNENLYQLFLKKMEDTEITRASEQKQIRNPYKIIDPALMPLKPVKPNKTKLLMMGLALGLSLGIVWIFLLEFFSNTLKEVDEVTQRFGIPNLGVVPLINLGKGTKMDLDNFFAKESGYLTEFIRLYKNIEVRGRQQTILFTSSLKGEGKSLLISCLALTAVRMQKEPVLIIDGDLRSRRLHRLFKVPNDIGLSDLLQEQAELDVAIKETQYPNLHILTAGKEVNMPGELVEQPVFAQLLETLKTKYRYILLDTPPIIPVNDAISYSRNVDVVIYTIMAGKTPLDMVERGIRILEQAQVKIFGTVVNNQNNALTAAGYSYEYIYPYK